VLGSVLGGGLKRGGGPGVSGWYGWGLGAGWGGFLRVTRVGVFTGELGGGGVGGTWFVWRCGLGGFCDWWVELEGLCGVVRVGGGFGSVWAGVPCGLWGGVVVVGCVEIVLVLWLVGGAAESFGWRGTSDVLIWGAGGGGLAFAGVGCGAGVRVVCGRVRARWLGGSEWWGCVGRGGCRGGGQEGIRVRVRS